MTELKTSRPSDAPMKEHSEASEHHGGFDALYFRRMNRSYDPTLDFSVNINPWGPSDALESAVRAVNYEAYPDPSNLLVREKVAGQIGVDADQVMVDAGSCRILWTIVQGVLGAGDVALVVDPTFGEFHRAVESVGARLVRHRRIDEPRWRLCIETLSEQISSSGAKLLYLCDPNNPTGELLPADVIPTLAARHPECRIIWDEAYRFLTRSPDARAMQAPSNVIRLQSLTKEQGVPGLRIGYAVMDAAFARTLQKRRPAWCCGNAEEVGIAAAVAGRHALPAMLETWFSERDQMVEAARSAGFEVQVADVPWFLLRKLRATELRDAAVRDEGMLMRDCASFGIPDALRVCPRRPDANRRWESWVRGLNAADWRA